MSNWYFNNSSSRTPLDKKSNNTILFKYLFPTYADWKTAILTNTRNTEQMVLEQVYDDLMGMIGNSWLKYSTSDKNIALVAYQFNKFQVIKEREENLYTQNFKALLQNTNTSTQKQYLVNRNEDDVQIVDEKFLDNSVVNQIANEFPQIVYMKEYKEFINMKNPTLKMVEHLAQTIVLPYTNDKGDLY